MTSNNQYYLKYSENTEKKFISVFKRKPSTSEVRKSKMNPDGTYEITPINSISMNKLSLLEYSEMLKNSGASLIIFLDKDYLQYFSKEDIEIYTHRSFEGIDYFSRIDNDKDNYRLIDRMFRTSLGKCIFKTVLVSKTPGKSGYTIEQYPESIELKMGVVDRSLKSKDIQTGIYLSIEGDNYKDDLEEYIFEFEAKEDGSFEMTQGHINLLPKRIPASLTVVEKNQYIHLIRKSLLVALSSLSDGRFHIRLLTDDNPLKSSEEQYYMLPDREKYLLESQKIGGSIIETVETLDLSDGGIVISKGSSK